MVVPRGYMKQYPYGGATGIQKYKEWLIWAGFGKEYIDKALERYRTCSQHERELKDLL